MFKGKNRKQLTTFDYFNYTFLSIILVIILYPLIYIVSASLSSGEAVIQNRVYLWPVDITLEGYQAILRHKLILSGFMNSLIYMVCGTGLNVLMVLIAAYPLSRKDLPGRKIIMMIFVFTMMFNGGMIPSYLVVKKLGILYTRLAVILPVAISAYYVIIARTYFETTIPTSILEACKLDGCSDIQFIFYIVIHLSKPIIAVIGLFCAVSHWNSYFNAMLYLKDTAMFPLQLVLRDILISSSFDSSMIDVEQMERLEQLKQLLRYSIIVVASAPVLMLYPFVQKYFVKGIMVGAIKG